MIIGRLYDIYSNCPGFPFGLENGWIWTKCYVRVERPCLWSLQAKFMLHRPVKRQSRHLRLMLSRAWRDHIHFCNPRSAGHDGPPDYHKTTTRVLNSFGEKTTAATTTATKKFMADINLNYGKTFSGDTGSLIKALNLNKENIHKSISYWRLQCVLVSV